MKNPIFSTTSYFNYQQNSLESQDNVVLFGTSKAVVIVNDKTSTANIFFDEGFRRSYICSEFAEKLGFKPESYENLSVSGF